MTDTKETPPPQSHVVGAPFITKEWFERRAKAEADLEIGAGFSVVTPTDADIAQMEVLAEQALPEWAQTELARLRAIALDMQTGYIAVTAALKSVIEDLELRSKNGVVDLSHGVYCAARAALSAPENGVAVSGSQDGDHSLTSGRGISQVRPPEDDSTVAPSGDPDFREIDAIDVAAANIRADYSAGKISKEQFQKEMLIVTRARQQESAALSAPEAEG